MRRTLLSLMLVTAVACRQQAGPLSEADVVAIREVAADIDSAALSHDWDRVFDLFADDAMSMAQGYPTLERRAAIQAAVEEAMAGLTVTGHTITFETIDGMGDLAYTTGTYVEAYAIEGGDQPIEVRGRVFGVLRKRPDGAWRITVWSTNTES